MLDALIQRYAKQQPEYDFIAPIDGFRHQFWIISDDKDIACVTDAFSKMPTMYIADGHHRSAAAALVGAEKAKQNPHHTGKEEYNYFMAVCFQASQLTILDYNRVLKDLNGLSSEEFLSALGKNFDVTCKGAAEYKPRIYTSSPCILMVSGTVWWLRSILMPMPILSECWMWIFQVV